MIKRFLLSLLFLISGFFLFYIILPNPSFPKPPPDSIQSTEPADTETMLRRAYFTNYTRDQVMDWYGKQFDHSSFLQIKLPTYKLNYPPEDSQTIIRDQTRSTFLEEIVHPFRESIYINGFEPGPDDPKDAINIQGKNWRQKIIIRFVPSPLIIRIFVFIGIWFTGYLLFKSWKEFLNNIKNFRIKI